MLIGNEAVFDGNEAVFDGVVYEATDEIHNCDYCVFNRLSFECNHCYCTNMTRPDKRNVVWKRKKNKMERIIELNKPEIVDGKIQVTIKYQSHIGKEFGNSEVGHASSSFIASNGMKLCSYYATGYIHSDKVYVKGARDFDEPIKFPSLEEYNMFIQAVEEYNYVFRLKVKEVTLDEIEKQLGYKIKIVNK